MEKNRIEISTNFITNTVKNSSIIIDTSFENLKNEIIDDMIIFVDRIAIAETTTHLTELIGNKRNFVLEHDKNQLQNVAHICKFFSDNRIKKSDKLCIIGNKNFISAMGFACSVYLGGIEFYLVPTTLWAVTDSIGGIHYLDSSPTTKYDIEIITHPTKILINPELSKLTTNRIFCIGLTNMLRYGLINSLPLFNKLNRIIHTSFDKRDIDDIKLIDMIEDIIRSKIEILKFKSTNATNLNNQSFINTGEALTNVLNNVYKCEINYGEQLAFGLELVVNLSLMKYPNCMTPEQYVSFKTINRALNPKFDIIFSKENLKIILEVIKDTYKKDTIEMYLISKIGTKPTVHDIEISEIEYIFNNWSELKY